MHLPTRQRCTLWLGLPISWFVTTYKYEMKAVIVVDPLKSPQISSSWFSNQGSWSEVVKAMNTLGVKAVEIFPVLQFSQRILLKFPYSNQPLKTVMMLG